MSQNSLNNQTYDADFIAFRQPASAGTTCFIAANHTDTTNAGSTAQVVAQSTAASGADAFHISALASTRAWCHGIDASDGESLKEATQNGGSTSPSTGTVTRKVTTAGEQTMPLQPMFEARQTVSSGGVTGAGTVYYLGNNGGATTVVTVDQNSDTSFVGGDLVFTAPVSGNYLFLLAPIIDSITAAMTQMNLYFERNGATIYWGTGYNIGAIRTPGNGAVPNCSLIISLNASDTIKFAIQIGNGAGDTASLRGSLVVPSNQTSVQGFLIC